MVKKKKLRYKIIFDTDLSIDFDSCFTNSQQFIETLNLHEFITIGEHIVNTKKIKLIEKIN